jgi:outer membrane protein OmpA-like peptidoglycan-associated protein
MRVVNSSKTQLLISLVTGILLTGCSTMSNQELRDKFAAQGFETTERDLGVIVFFPGVLFEYDKYALTPPAVSKVLSMASILNDPKVEDRLLLLEGHTDSNGTDEYNHTLSLNRAMAVYKELVADNVKAQRMKVDGFGETRPLVENLNADGSPNLEGQAKNRRVEIIIKNE